MKKIFNFTKKKRLPSSTPDNGSVLSFGYEVKEKDLGKVHKAAWVGDVSKLKQLAKKNDLNQLDKENRTALHIACASGHVEVVQFLVESKAKLNLCDNQNRSPLMKAVQGQHECCVCSLLENHADPNLVDINGNTSLHLAANIPSISTATLLLEHDADINAQNKDGFTPLSVAIRENHVEMAEFLLREGADVNVRDQGQRSPLMIAASSGQISMVRLLLQYDADITLKDVNGWSSDDHAAINGHHACSHLIIEHGTKRNPLPPSSHQASTKKKRKNSPSEGGEAGFSLGGPAIDKDDLEDNSQSESVSRASKSAADDWPSSDEDDDDDELELSPKKTQKVNLKKLIASKRGEHAVSTQPDRPLSGDMCEPESDDSVQRIPSHPKALPSSKAPQHPVAPSPVLFSKAPQMISTPLLTTRKSVDKTKFDEEEEDSDEEEEGEENDQEEEEEGALPVATAPDNSKDKQMDFLLELGMEKGEEEEDSWDSESLSERSPRKTQAGHRSSLARSQTEMSVGEKGTREAVSKEGDGSGSEDSDNNDDSPQKETEKTKWQPLSVLSKLEGDAIEKPDLMEELGLGDADDFENASDWDSASTTSRRTIPGQRVASPGVEELPEWSTPPAQETPTAAPPIPKRSISSAKRPSPQPSPRSHASYSPQTLLQPHASKMLTPKPESGDESDWDSDNVTSSSSPVSPVKRLPDLAEAGTVIKPGSPVPDPSPMARDSDGYSELVEEPLQVRDDALDTSKLDLNKPNQFWLVGSGCAASNDGPNNQEGPEGRSNTNTNRLWEKGYEKLWVEVEKRQVISTYRNVAGELKKRFGELPHFYRSTAENTIEEQQVEEISSEEEGEPIVQPTARPRSAVLLTIPEQRELGLEDSVTESAENFQCEDRTWVCEWSRTEELHLVSDGVLEKCTSLSSQQLARSYTTGGDPDENDDFPNVFSGATCKHVNAGRSSDNEIRLEPTRPEPIMEEHSNAAPPNSSTKSPVASEEDPEEHGHSRLPSPTMYSAISLGTCDGEVDEDMWRFKHEVGILKVVVLDVEEEKAQLQREAGRKRTNTAMEEEKSDAFEEAQQQLKQEQTEEEKPETCVGCLEELANGDEDIPEEGQLTVTQSLPKRLACLSSKSSNRYAVQQHILFQQSCHKEKQQGGTVDVGRTSQLQHLVRGARSNRAPQTTTQLNGDPLSVFDDSTLSEVSDDEGRSSSGQRKHETLDPEKIEMEEDLDELTQSSDTATDDLDSPTSGYRHASLLIQKLDSATLDSRTMVKLQNIFHEYERSIQKARSRHGHQADKVSQLEMERAELRSSLEEVKDVKSALERHQLELQTEVNNLKFQLKQEQENRRNATMMYETTKEKLRRTEVQQQQEVEERQKVELTLRNLELERRTLVNNMKMLEQDRSENQRLLAQERSARTLQENLLNNHLRKQQEMEEENRKNVSRSNEALSQLTEASDREKELLQQTVSLQEELSLLRTELDRSRANSHLEESRLVEENEALRERLEDLRRDLKLNEDALAQTVFQYNSQLSTLKSELAISTTRLEHERQARETLEAEVESIRNRLTGATQEVDRCQATRADAEKALLREKEELQRVKDKHTGEAASQREAVSSLSQKLAKAEARANSLENEVHRATLQLTEKGLLLEALQREKDQAVALVKELENTRQAERELACRATARQEATQERLAQAQSESMLLRQQLEEAQNKGVAKERAVTDAQERFSDILSKLRSDCEERVQLMEERNRELAGKAANLREQLFKQEEEKNEREAGVRQLQQELADSLKKLSMSEASLEVNTRYRNDLDEEKARLLKDMDRLKGKLEESEDQFVEAERRVNGLKSSLNDRERELSTTAQRLQEALSATQGSENTIRQLEETVQRLEIENAGLEAAAKQQSNRIEVLQKGAQEASLVRSRLEDLVTNLQGSKMSLENQLSREVQKQSVLSHTAQDSQALWEEELKSRSKLGLRLAELEKEKGELSSQMELERKKAKKISEQKKAMDTRLDQEMKRNTDLQKEMYRLRTMLKTAKKKLREQDSSGAELGFPMNSLRMEMAKHSLTDASLGRTKEKVEELQVQLEKEAFRCRQLEKVNGELKEKLAAQRTLSRSNELLERTKRQLEEEVSGLRRQLEAGLVDQSQAEQYRHDTEERARQVIRQKLEEVNFFLQTQAASQEALDQLKSTNEINLRSQLEQRIQELERELGQVQTAQQDSLNQRQSTRSELERYQELYAEELRLRKSLAAKLERANTRLAEANAKLLNERHRSKSLITSSIANGSMVGPSLDINSLGSAPTYGAALGPLGRSLSLGLPLLSPMTEGQNSRVEDYLAKMQTELESAISKELDHGMAELDGGLTRVSPVGSASGTELDPVSRATQQYLEVLKKNYMI